MAVAPQLSGLQRLMRSKSKRGCRDRHQGLKEQVKDAFFSVRENQDCSDP